MRLSIWDQLEKNLFFFKLRAFPSCHILTSKQRTCDSSALIISALFSIKQYKLV